MCVKSLHGVIPGAPMQPALTSSPKNALERARAVAAAMPKRGLFAGTEWRVAPRPLPLAADLVKRLEELGPQLAAFYRACNLLYRFSVRGTLPRWIADYLDAGKPAALIEASRLSRFRSALPRVIRPDILLQENEGSGVAFTITELDSVPGGIGLTAWLNQTYAALGDNIIGGSRGMRDGFAQILCECSDVPTPSARILVSVESETYRPEMEWLAQTLADEGMDVQAVRPEQLELENGRRPDVVYRFFELFDIPNVPNAPALLEAAGAGRIAVTPPFKPQLEEKMLFAFFWHTGLKGFWRQELGERVFAALQQVIPYTWILDPTPLPPHAVIPELGIRDWREMAAFSQKQRELVMKLSGFHADAWGSRSVVVGHDVPASEWAAAIDRALRAFPRTPYILQRFHRAAVVEAEWADLGAGHLRVMNGRVRLCPYYFVVGDETRLAGVLATICPQDKKIIHGMADAIMAPCCQAEHSQQI
ncbi:MAG: hypothetical protein N2689_05880 [Verrucomicrobiae bacterium]|nr:hypothetical protein [Verrucomicrobiae bacterium]